MTGLHPSNSPQAKSSNNATQNSPQNLEYHPIALEMIRFDDYIRTNEHGQRVSGRKLQFQGIVKVLNNKKVSQIQKIAMTGKRMTLNQKLVELYILLDCSLATAKGCTFEGKIHIKKAKASEVARQIQIEKKFETVPNVTRIAVRFMQYLYAKRNIKVLQIYFFVVFIFLTAPSIDLYEPHINVLSPHTCIGRTEYVPISILDDHELLKIKFDDMQYMWQQKLEEIQNEKKKLEEKLERIEKKRAKEKATIRELKSKNAKLIKEKRKFNSEKKNLKKKAEESEEKVKIKTEAVEKIQENMMKREEKLSKERRNFNAEQRKLNEKITATLLDWTGARRPNEQAGPGPTDSSNATESTAARPATINPSIPVSRPTGQDDDETLPPLVNVKPEIKTELVRDPDFVPNPLRTRPILDRGAKRRYSDIIILN